MVRLLQPASGINDAGQVVGIRLLHWERDGHAFVTGPNGIGMRDLNSLVGVPAGVVLVEAIGINNAGQVIATAIFRSRKSMRSFFRAWPWLVSSRGERRLVGKLLA